ncbi:2114_t:CDS:2, partial [Gigaspora rosea]
FAPSNLQLHQLPNQYEGTLARLVRSDLSESNKERRARERKKKKPTSLWQKLHLQSWEGSVNHFINVFWTYNQRYSVSRIVPATANLFGSKKKRQQPFLMVENFVEKELLGLNLMNKYVSCLATAHPAKFSAAVEESLNHLVNSKFQEILPKRICWVIGKRKKMCVYRES